MQGKVIIRGLNDCWVKTLNGDIHNVLLPNKRLRLLVGDQVDFINDSGSLKVQSVYDRKTEIHKANSNLEPELFAVNITQLAVVIAPNPKPDLLLLDSFLCAADRAGISTLLVINKSDLEINASAELESYPVDKQIHISTKFDQNMNELLGLLDNQASLLVGQSGVGKSSILNKIMGEEIQKIRALNKNQGTHTTSTSYLYSIDRSSDIVDTPGVRGFIPYFKEKSEISSAFAEIFAHASRCKFPNCLHVNEPNCGVKDAIEESQIQPSRYKSYLHLLSLY